MEVSLMKISDPTGMDRIVQLVMHCNPMPQAQRDQTERELLDFMREDRNLLFVLKTDVSNIVGFLGIKPHDLALDDLINFDPLMKHDPERYYFEMLGIEKDFRGGSGFLLLMLMGMESCVAKGINCFSAHFRINNGINRRMKRLFPHHKGYREIPNWMGGGEPYEYVEFTVTESDIGNIRKVLEIY